MDIPLLSDLSQKIGKDFGCFDEEAGHTARGLYLIDIEGTVRHVTVNDFPVGRNVDEVLRLLQVSISARIFSTLIHPP